jgi:molecular chaperone DnaK
MSVAIGIDLGTTNTVVAAVVDGVASTLIDDQGRRLLPSVVSFHPTSTVLVGEPARERRLIDPENTIFSVKPLLGRSWDSPEVVAARSRFPFSLTQGTKNSTMVLSRDVAYALPEISAFVLRRAKSIAEAALGQPVDRAVITVPANFNDLQRASTKIAGKLAGLDVMRILNEPTAAALAYGQSVAKAEKIAVYDLGGGTFDITLLDLTGNVFEVLATAGDTALGGDDVDRLVVDRIADDVLKRFNVDPRTSPASSARLLFLAEEIKKELSRGYQAHREITGVGYMESGQSIATTFALTRAQLETLAKPLVERTLMITRQAIGQVGLQPRDFDRVILVGGSTRMPAVALAVEKLFGKQPHLRVNPDEVVALGAAIQAHALNRTKAAHRRRSASDQLSRSEPPRASGDKVSTRPPDADPAPTPARVPKAPPVPDLAGAGNTPAYFTFNKAPAVISFSSAPPAEKPRLTPTAKPPPPPARSAKPPPPPPARPAPPRPPAPAPAAAPAVPDLPPPRPPAATLAGVGPRTYVLEDDLADDAIVPADAPSFDLDLPAPGERSLVDEVPPDPSSQESAGPDFFTGLELAHIPAPTPEQFAQGSAIATSEAAPLLIDVTPLSLGVETAGGYSDVIIPANSPVPCEKTRTFLTASDGQSMVSIRVAQGESTRFLANTRLGDLVLTGLRQARRGEVRIKVTFELDVDGLLNVRAVDQDTGRATEATMRVLGASTDAEDVRAMAARQARHEVA